MKKFFLAIVSVLALALSSCTYNTYHTINASPAQKTYSPGMAYQSIARLYIQSPGGQVTATGFAVDKDHLMTAAHFCISALEVQIFETHTENIQMEHYEDDLSIRHQSGLEVAELSRTRDLCLVKKENHGLQPLKMAQYNNVKVRDKVWIVGAPMGVFLAEYPGRIISTNMQHKNSKLKGKLVVSAASTGGVSGSPVLNDKGEVIGVLVMGPMFFDHISICVPGSKLSTLMNKIK